jgi:pimeloyl-ACP methyl ester carboxylesterase
MADDAAGVLQSLDIPSAHVAGFSGGSIIAQELELRHPELVRSLVLQSTWPVMDSYLRSWLLFVRWLVEVAPSERAFLERFFLDIYTPRAHNDGTVDQIIEEVLAFPHKQSTEDLQHFPTPSLTTTRPTAYRRSPPRRSCSPAAATRPLARRSAAPSRS